MAALGRTQPGTQVAAVLPNREPSGIAVIASTQPRTGFGASRGPAAVVTISQRNLRRDFGSARYMVALLLACLESRSRQHGGGYLRIDLLRGSLYRIDPLVRTSCRLQHRMTDVGSAIC